MSKCICSVVKNKLALKLHRSSGELVPISMDRVTLYLVFGFDGKVGLYYQLYTETHKLLSEGSELVNGLWLWQVRQLLSSYATLEDMQKFAEQISKMDSSEPF